MSESYKKIAIEFAQTLADNNFISASELLSSQCTDDLDFEFKEMVSYGDGPVTDIELMTTMEEWPAKKSGDIGWAYVAMSGNGFSEAVAVIVCESEGAFKIREIEWGRP